MASLLEGKGFSSRKIIGKLRGEEIDLSSINLKTYGNVYETKSFVIYYDKKDIDASDDNNDKVWATKISPDENSQTLNLTEGIPLYVIDVGKILESARDAYIEAGFRYPGWDSSTKTQTSKIKVYIDYNLILSSTSYSPISGNITLDGNSLFHANTLKHDVSHELFHAVQYQYYNYVTQAAKLTGRTWWFEASAEYAAYKTALKGTGGGPREIMRRYHRCSITHNETFGQNDHAYATGWFIDYMVKNGANFKDMWEYIAKAEWSDLGSTLVPMDRYLKENTKKDLASMYQGFIKEVVFGQNYIKRYELSDPPVKADGVGETVDVWIKRGVDDKNKKIYPFWTFANYTSTVYGITATPFPNKNSRSLKISLQKKPQEGFDFYVYKLKGNKRSGAEQVGTFSHTDSVITPIKVDLEEGDGLYVLATNSTSKHSDNLLIIEEGEDEEEKKVRITFTEDKDACFNLDHNSRVLTECDENCKIATKDKKRLQNEIKKKYYEMCKIKCPQIENPEEAIKTVSEVERWISIEKCRRGSELAPYQTRYYLLDDDGNKSYVEYDHRYRKLYEETSPEYQVVLDRIKNDTLKKYGCIKVEERLYHCLGDLSGKYPDIFYSSEASGGAR